MSKASPSIIMPPVLDARAQQIEQCQAVTLTAVGLLGPMHALLVGGPGTTAVIVLLLLTGAQAFAVFSIISAIFVANELKKNADLNPFVVRIPAVCCSVAGTLLVVATCIVHWKATYGIAVLAIIFLLVVYRSRATTFGKGIATGCASVLSRLRAPRAGEVDVEISPAANSGSAENGEAVDGLGPDVWPSTPYRLLFGPR